MHLFFHVSHGENFKAEVEVIFRYSAASLLSDKSSFLPFFFHMPFYHANYYHTVLPTLGGSNSLGLNTSTWPHTHSGGHTASLIPPWESIIKLLKTPNSTQSGAHPLREQTKLPGRAAGKERTGILSICRMRQHIEKICHQVPPPA